MMKFSKKQLALAVGTVLGAASLIPSAQAVNLATDGLGQVLIFPYYTTRAGWNTLFNITNTSDRSVAVKVRFHEAYNSRDVFDFNVVLSPRDVWTAWVENGPNNIPQIVTNDNSCTIPRLVPNVPQPFQGSGANGLLAYTGDAEDGGPTNTERMREGYVAILMMGASESNPTEGLAADAVHDDGIPADCAAIRTAFATPTTAAFDDLNEAFSFMDGINPLKGMFSLVNAEAGQNAGGSPVTVADFRTSTLVTLQLPPTDLANPVTAAAFNRTFHEPSLNSANTGGQVLLADGTSSNAPVPNLPPASLDVESGYFGSDQLSWVLLRDTVNNHWTRRTNPADGWLTASDWVVTFPTKGYYVDEGSTEFAAINSYRGDRPTRGPRVTSPFSNFFDTIEDDEPVLNGKSCDPVTYRIFNREEVEIVREQGPVFSPAPTPEGNTLCYETNVLTFDGSKVLGSAAPLTGNVNQLPGIFGWMRLNLASAANTLAGTVSTSDPGFGLPVVGFSITTRTTPASLLLNEAYLVDHAYTRRVPFAPQTAPQP